ncbi:MAG: FecR family protein [Myxococcota bacterium]
MLLATLLLTAMPQAPALAIGVTGFVEVDTGTYQALLQRFDEVPEGSTVITHANASARLRFASGSLVRLGENTRINLERLQQKQPAGKRRESLKLVVGRMWAKVTHLFGDDASFEVQTDNAVAGVRGTTFMVEATGVESLFMLLEGALEIQREDIVESLDTIGVMLHVNEDGKFTIDTTPASPEQIDAMRREIGGTGGELIDILSDEQTFDGLPDDIAQAFAWINAGRDDIVGPNGFVDSPLGDLTLPGLETGLPALDASQIDVRVNLP